jgi:hypothetical protein
MLKHTLPPEEGEGGTKSRTSLAPVEQMPIDEKEPQLG